MRDCLRRKVWVRGAMISGEERQDLKSGEKILEKKKRYLSVR